MERRMINKCVFGILACVLVLPQFALAAQGATAHYFDGRLLTEADLRTVQVSMPGLFNPATGLPSTREDFEKPISLTKSMDSLSSVFESAYYSGEPMNSFVIMVPVKSANKDKPTCYLKYELTNVLVSSYSVSGAAASDGVPVEDITLNYEEIKVTYR